MEAFGPGGPPADRDQRSRSMDSLPDAVGELWQRLDGEFYALPSPQSGLQTLVESNRAAFFAP